MFIFLDSQSCLITAALFWPAGTRDSDPKTHARGREKKKGGGGEETAGGDGTQTAADREGGEDEGQKLLSGEETQLCAESTSTVDLMDSFCTIN